MLLTPINNVPDLQQRGAQPFGSPFNGIGTAIVWRPDLPAVLPGQVQTAAQLAAILPTLPPQSEIICDNRVASCEIPAGVTLDLKEEINLIAYRVAAPLNPTILIRDGGRIHRPGQILGNVSIEAEAVTFAPMTLEPAAGGQVVQLAQGSVLRLRAGALVPFVTCPSTTDTIFALYQVGQLDNSAAPGVPVVVSGAGRTLILEAFVTGQNLGLSLDGTIQVPAGSTLNFIYDSSSFPPVLFVPSPGTYNKLRIDRAAGVGYLDSAPLLCPAIPDPSVQDAIDALKAITGAPGAALITNWYVDPTTGSNTNNGTAPGTPLLNGQEAIRRVGLASLDVAATINYLGTGLDGEALRIVGMRGTGSLTVQGARTAHDAIAAYTVASLAAWSPTASTIGTFQLTAGDTTNPDLTALGYVGLFVSLDSDPTQTIEIIDDLGAGTFHGAWVTQGAGVSAPPVDGSAVTVYSVNGLDGTDLEIVRSGGPSVSVVDFWASGNIRITAGAQNTPAEFTVRLLECHGGADGAPMRIMGAGRPYVEGGQNATGVTSEAGAGIEAVGFACINPLLGGAVMLDTVLVYGGSTLDFGSRGDGGGDDGGSANAVLTGPVAVLDYSTGAGVGLGVWVHGGSEVRSGNAFFTTNTTTAGAYGMRVDGYAAIVWTEGPGNPFGVGPDVITTGIPPATADFLVGHQDTDSSQLPFIYLATVGNIAPTDGSGSAAAITRDAPPPP